MLTNVKIALGVLIRLVNATWCRKNHSSLENSPTLTMAKGKKKKKKASKD